MRFILPIREIQRVKDRSVNPLQSLDRRRDVTLPRHDTDANSRNLDKLEEEAIVRHIIERDARIIGATRTMVEESANDLRVARGKGPVGKNWVDSFMVRTPEIKL